MKTKFHERRVRTSDTETDGRRNAIEKRVTYGRLEKTSESLMPEIVGSVYNL